ncbi:MAG: hypothetical protein AAF456_19155, partial [Planctomycetota bacterium]
MTARRIQKTACSILVSMCAFLPADSQLSAQETDVERWLKLRDAYRLEQPTDEAVEEKWDELLPQFQNLLGNATTEQEITRKTNRILRTQFRFQADETARFAARKKIIELAIDNNLLPLAWNTLNELTYQYEYANEINDRVVIIERIYTADQSA